VLAALAAEGVRASFFMNGDAMRRHPDLVRQVQAAGHTVGMHGDTHARFGELTPEAQRADLAAMLATCREILGHEPAAYRFPYLAETEPLRAALREQRITVMSADLGIEDWLPAPAPRHLADKLSARLQETGGGIVLLHDAQLQTAEALPLMLRVLRRQGWRVVHLQWP
jgi:peptidoglycan/xylan/chitin deacetylase (PgdA/CDA1 family)